MHINVYSYEFPGPLGRIGIAETDGSISRLFLSFAADGLDSVELFHMFSKEKLTYKCGLEARESAPLRLAAKQIEEYLGGARASFEIPLTYSKKGFAGAVYDELQKIPAGQTRSYKEIAELCDNPKAYRAVGMLNHNNPIPIFIPCHRVVGSDGGLTGYAGGLQLKKYLLDLEKKYYA